MAKRPRAKACPICRRPAAQGFEPFCSKRCADVDLARWLGGAYAIPGERADIEEVQEAAPSSQTTGADPGSRR